LKDLPAISEALRKGEVSDGQPLSIGRKSRSIPPAIRRALRARDRGCRFPGCINRYRIDGHHIRHWADGGETSLDNLLQLCRHHHRLLHEGGFSCERTIGNSGGKIVFRNPYGQVIAPTPLSTTSGSLVDRMNQLLARIHIGAVTFNAIGLTIGVGGLKRLTGLCSDLCDVGFFRQSIRIPPPDRNFLARVIFHNDLPDLARRYAVAVVAIRQFLEACCMFRRGFRRFGLLDLRRIPVLDIAEFPVGLLERVERPALAHRRQAL
jgi:hypothetical protein